MARQRILLTGSWGNLGQALLKQLTGLETDELLTPSREELDLVWSQEQLTAALDELKPDVIINPAAYTNVDKAESEPELAYQINGQAPGVMAAWAKQHQAYLLHFSTDYVFDGSKETPYTPEDVPNPLGLYAKSKLEGEKNILDQASEESLILRVSWLFGRKPAGFVHFLLNAAKENTEQKTASPEGEDCFFAPHAQIKAVCDQVGTPTWTNSVAELLPRLLNERPTGLCHACNHGEISRYQQAVFLYEQLGIPIDRIEKAVSADFFQTAKRPQYTAMLSSFDEMPTWEKATVQFLKELNTPKMVTV